MAATKSRGVSRVVIGVDPHERIDAVVVLDEAGAVLARETVEHTSSGFRTLMGPARRFPRRTWAVEGCNGVGKNLAQRLVAGGETVLDVSTRKPSLVRALATNSGRKTDDTDAYSIALVGHGASPGAAATHVTFEAPGDFDLDVERRDWDDTYGTQLVT